MPLRTIMPNFWQVLLEANRRRSQHWGADKLDLAFKGLEMGGEVGEFLNHIKKIQRERLGVKGSRTTKEAALLEFGDVMICAALILNNIEATETEIINGIACAFNNKSFELNLPIYIGIGGTIVETYGAEETVISP